MNQKPKPWAKITEAMHRLGKKAGISATDSVELASFDPHASSEQHTPNTGRDARGGTQVPVKRQDGPDGKSSASASTPTDA